jgi:hypothetical protein
LNVTVFPVGEGPKFTPEIVTDVPTRPELGKTLVMLGVTVKATALLSTPLTVSATFPVLAPGGTGTTMVVLLQLVGVA